MKRSLLVLVTLSALLLAGCGDPSSPNADKPQSLSVTVPATAVVGEPLTVTIVAAGNGSAGFDMDLVLSVSEGTVTPASVRLTGDRVEFDVTISDAAGEVSLLAQAGSVTGSGTIRSLTIRQLPGGADELVAARTPEIPYVPREEDYSRNHPEAPGMLISHNTMLMLPATVATVGGFNALLAEIDALVVGAIPGAVGVAAGTLVVRVPGSDHAAFDELLAALRSDARVAAAAQDVGLTPTREPAPQRDIEAPLAWEWGSPPSDGNWGLELVRAPQMWNLNAALQKREARVPTGVLDVGFDSLHRDLALDVHGPNDPDDHGTHVAGIIGAGFDNGRGIDGMNPFAAVHGVVPPSPLLGMLSSSFWLDGYLYLVRNVPGMRVINMSLGYNWGESGVDTDDSAFARMVASSHGATVDAALRVLAAESAAPILVVSSGNDSRPRLQQAVWNSPMTNAALEHGNPGIIVVEAVASDRAAPGDATRADFSNVNAHVSAPGADIVSTSVPQPYESMSGTSMAAPQVTGLVGYLLALSPTLDAAEIRQLLTGNARSVGGGASARIDAFASALDIDRVRGDDAVLRMLCDIDDGSVDGNLRVDPYTLAEVIQEDIDRDGGVGDGNVDMSDFRRWRDWLVQTMGLNGGLDGAADHPKFDIDGDGRVADAADENVYPRGDFNGDGQLSQTAVAFVPGAINAVVTDLAALQRVFQDPDYAADRLPALIVSADIHFNAAAMFDAPQVTAVKVTVEGAAGIVDERVLNRTRRSGVLTVPAESEGYVVHATALDGAGSIVGEEHHDTEVLQLGQNLALSTSGERIALAVALPGEVEAGVLTPVSVRAGLVGADGDTTYTGFMEILLSAEGGNITPQSGFTDASGRFRAQVTALPGVDVLVVTATAVAPGGTTRRMTSRVPVVGAGVIVTDWVGTHLDYDYGDCNSCTPIAVTARTIQDGNALTFLYDLVGPPNCAEHPTAQVILYTTVSPVWTAFSGDGFRFSSVCETPASWTNLPVTASLSGDTLTGAVFYQNNCTNGCYYEFTLVRQ